MRPWPPTNPACPTLRVPGQRRGADRGEGQLPLSERGEASRGARRFTAARRRRRDADLQFPGAGHRDRRRDRLGLRLDRGQDHRIREGELGWMEDFPTPRWAGIWRAAGRELDADLHGGESLDPWPTGSGRRSRGDGGRRRRAGAGQPRLRDPGAAAPADPESLPRFIGNGDVVEVVARGRRAGRAAGAFPVEAARRLTPHQPAHPGESRDRGKNPIGQTPGPSPAIPGCAITTPKRPASSDRGFLWIRGAPETRKLLTSLSISHWLRNCPRRGNRLGTPCRSAERRPSRRGLPPSSPSSRSCSEVAIARPAPPIMDSPSTA